jgi:dTDP-glucose 4,6-dehydratase
MAYHRAHGMRVRIARIFNTYGPRMRRDDGRAVPTFIRQALAGEPLTVHGDGSQTRSLCYVDDLVDGIYRLIVSEHSGPVNIGNPSEITMLHLAELIRDVADSSSPINFVDRPTDDPEVRCPDIALAMKFLRWQPVVRLADGIRRTIDWATESWT